MRFVLLLVFALPTMVVAENDLHLAQVIHQGKVRRIDKHMRRMIHREGRNVRAATYLHPMGGAEDRISELYWTLRKQIGVNAVDWDRCVAKPGIWPGTWTLGIVFRTREGKVDDILERCYVIQGGRPGTIHLFGWRPRVRKSRDELKVLRCEACEGFLEEQRRLCGER